MGTKASEAFQEPQQPAPSIDELNRLLSLCEVQSARSGVPLPLGAHVRGHGVNFALFSRNATGVRLDLFDHADDQLAARTFILNPTRNKTGDIWHIWLEGIQPGQYYGFRVAGPYQPHEGHRFNPNKLLLDPYATAVALVPDRDFSQAVGYDLSSAELDLSISEGDDAGIAPKSVIAHSDFDWRGDQPLCRPWGATVIYELHVRGFTSHRSAASTAPGTYRGLVERIPYFKQLGITAIELMPVQEFNEFQLHRRSDTGEPLKNFWGYDPLSFFAPKASYASVGPGVAHLLEFKEMVRSFHSADIEIILDVVFNHTIEGNELGPTLTFRGIDNSIYYWLNDDKRFYRDFTGTGQTINAAHPIVRDLILDALRYWVMEMHVDGFRFDLASVLGRDKFGNLLADAPLLERIAEDPILRDTKLIAEAWDAAGAYQVGSFYDRRWAEWNGRFRDDVRRFWRGDEGYMSRFATRICGSTDLYHGSGRGPECSINFVTCHDGFTLNDLVSYSEKHNEANGDGNRDGVTENYSANWGVEGDTDDPVIDALRTRQIKNFILTLAVSRGVPMLLGGDEFRRTQHGNNNCYCQDNETSWVDWALLQKNNEIFRFTQTMLQLRRTYPAFTRGSFYTEDTIRWYNPSGELPDWSDHRQKCLACRIIGQETPDLLLIFNADKSAIAFRLPSPGGQVQWRQIVDTAHPISDYSGLPLVHQCTYWVESFSSVILIVS